MNAIVISGRDAGEPSSNSCRGVCRECLPLRQRQLHRRAFSVIELVLVMLVMLILAGLILGISGYVQEKGKRSRAETEIAALAAALESYKADNAIYPRANETDALDTRTGLDPQTELSPDPAASPYPSKYVQAGLFLYKQLSGDLSANRQPSTKSYFSFPPTMLLPKGSSTSVTALVDPFGNCYGYSTSNQSDSTKGFNPTFDLWSTSGKGTGATPTPTPTATPTTFWIKNW